VAFDPPDVDEREHVRSKRRRKRLKEKIGSVVRQCDLLRRECDLEKREISMSGKYKQSIPNDPMMGSRAANAAVALAAGSSSSAGLDAASRQCFTPGAGPKECS